MYYALFSDIAQGLCHSFSSFVQRNTSLVTVLCIYLLYCKVCLLYVAVCYEMIPLPVTQFLNADIIHRHSTLLF